MSKPALYCGTYGKYNDGSIDGKWLYLDDYKDASEFLEACAELHKDDPDPEFMFQDYDELPKSLYSEALSPVDLERIYEWVNCDNRDMVAEYLEEVDSSVDIDDILESYGGQLDINGYNNEEEAYGYYCVENGLIDVPDHLLNYFDYESYGRDMLDGINITSSGYMFYQ